MPANNTTVLSDKPENTTLGVIIPIRPRAIAPPKEVIAKGIISVTNKTAMTARTIKVCSAVPIHHHLPSEKCTDIVIIGIKYNLRYQWQKPSKK